MSVVSAEKLCERILVVDDDAVFRSRLVRAFQERGHEIASAEDFDSAVIQAEQFKPSRILIDLRMPGKSGLDLIPQLKERLPNARIIVLTGYGSIATALDAVHLGAWNYLTKPTDADSILRAFEVRGVLDGRISTVKVPSLERVEWEHIQRVMNDCGGNVSRAAKILKMHRRSLQRKLSKEPPR